MEAKFKLVIVDTENNEIANVPEETLKYLEGIIEDALETDKRLGDTIERDTDLREEYEFSVTLDKGLLGNIF